MALSISPAEHQMLAYRLRYWHAELRCGDCGALTRWMDAAGWGARLVDKADPGGEPDVVLLCPVCAGTEFGEN